MAMEMDVVWDPWPPLTWAERGEKIARVGQDAESIAWWEGRWDHDLLRAREVSSWRCMVGE
jgi:hypothetical protein